MSLQNFRLVIPDDGVSHSRVLLTQHGLDVSGIEVASLEYIVANNLGSLQPDCLGLD